MSFKRLLRQIPPRLLLALFALAIIAHLVILLYYTQQHKFTQRRARRAAAIRQVMNIIHMVEATPSQELPQAVKALKEHQMIVTMTQKPQFDLQAKVLSYWRIQHLVPDNADHIQLSLQLGNVGWVNINAQISQSRLTPQLFLLLLESIIIVIALFYWWSISRFTVPLQHFQRAAETLGIDTTTKLEEYQGPAIVRKTAQAMNNMQQRIQDLIQDRTLLLAAISHDLRTPITRLKLRADRIDNPKLLKKIVNDLDEMDSMIEEILSFARNDHGNEKKIKLDLRSLLETLCYDFQDMHHHVTFSANKKRLPYLGRPLALKRAFSNIIENAIKYGKEANITLEKQGQTILIQVNDKGPGIPDDELDKVFAPFYRCDRSRSREIAGTGLGLATSRDIIIAHSGHIKIKNGEPSGLLVKIYL